MLTDALAAWLGGLDLAAQARALGALLVGGFSAPRLEDNGLEQHLLDAAREQRSFTVWNDFELHFRGGECVPAATLAAAWGAVRQKVGQRVRVRVRLIEGTNPDRDVAAWLNRVAHAPEAGIDAIFFESRALPSPARELGWDWPVAVGVPDGIEGDLLADRLRTFPWPELITLGRPSQGVEQHDFLLVNERLPGHVARRTRASMLLVDGSFPEAELARAAHTFQACAVGQLAIPLDLGLTQLIENLAHDEPLDLAWRSAFRFLAPPLWATTSFVEQSRVSETSAQLMAQLAALAEESSPAPVDETYVRRYHSFQDFHAFKADAAAEVYKALVGAAANLEPPARPDSSIFEEQLTNLANVRFDHESDGASKVARAARVLDGLAGQGRLPDRYLQARLWPSAHVPFDPIVPSEEPAEYVEPDQWYLVAVDLTGARANERAPRIPVGGLAFERGQERLQIVLSTPSGDVVAIEPGKPLPAPPAATAIGWLNLPRVGDSSIAWFALRPRNDSVEVRIIVVAGNRVLQTALLTGGGGVENGGDIAPLELRTEAVVRPVLEGANRRRKFDAALVVNRNTDGIPRMTVIADERVDLEHLGDAVAMFDSVSELSAQLTADPEGDAAEPEEALRRHLIAMAEVGVTLYRRLVLDTRLKELATSQVLGGPKVERLQIISAKPESYLPLEFLYEGESPDDDAKICPNHATGMRERDCETCPHRSCRAHVCPALFWGSTKIIERHAYQTPAPGDAPFAVIATPTTQNKAFPRARAAIFGHSDKAATTVPGQEALASIAAYLAQMTGSPCSPCPDWVDWRARVAQQSPTMLALVPHTEKVGPSYALEIGTNNFLKAGQVRPDIVGSAGPRLALLFGCTTGDARMPFASFPSNFRAAGAEVSIATISPVLGRHAAPAMKDLLAHLDEAWSSKTPKPLAELLLEFRAKQLTKSMPFGWVIVAYGDADWTFGGA